MSDDDNELKGIRNSDKLTFVDKWKSKFQPITDRAETGQVTYPRRDYLQAQADQRQREYEAEQRAAKKKGK